MSIKQKVEQLEEKINQLKSNTMSLEDQIDLYHQSLKISAEIENKLHKLKSTLVSEPVINSNDSI